MLRKPGQRNYEPDTAVFAANTFGSAPGDMVDYSVSGNPAYF